MALKWGNNNWLDTENSSDVECWLWKIYFKNYFSHTKLRITFFCIFQTAWKNDPRTRCFFPNFHSTIISTASQSPTCPCFTIHKVHMFFILCDVEEKICSTIVLGSCIISLSKLLLIQNGWLPSIHCKWVKSLALSLQASLSCAALFRLCQRCTEGRFAEVPTKTKGLEIHHVTFLFIFVGKRCL